MVFLLVATGLCIDTLAGVEGVSPGDGKMRLERAACADGRHLMLVTGREFRLIW